MTADSHPPTLSPHFCLTPPPLSPDTFTFTLSMTRPSTANTLVFQGIDVEELELGRDPNLVKCTDNYEDQVDCRGTRRLLAKFKKMEKQAEDIDRGRGNKGTLLLFLSNWKFVRIR